MPNPNIHYSGYDRPYVQYELPELKEIAMQAIFKNDLDIVHDVVYELQHRESWRANSFLSDLTIFVTNNI